MLSDCLSASTRGRLNSTTRLDVVNSDSSDLIAIAVSDTFTDEVPFLFQLLDNPLDGTLGNDHLYQRFAEHHTRLRVQRSQHLLS